MPRIGVIGSFNVYIYYERGGQHNHPHVHIDGNGVSCTLRIDNAEVLQGKLPRNKRREVQEYIFRHQAELRDNYNKLQNNEQTYWIED